MTGPVMRLLRRPVFWTRGYTVADVLLLAVCGAAVVVVLVLAVIAALPRAP